MARQCKVKQEVEEKREQIMEQGDNKEAMMEHEVIIGKGRCDRTERKRKSVLVTTYA